MIEIASGASRPRNDECYKTKLRQESFIWMDSPYVQRLLDVVASIIADEYIQIAKQNPDVFSPSPKPSPHWGEGKNGGLK